MWCDLFTCTLGIHELDLGAAQSDNQGVIQQPCWPEISLKLILNLLKQRKPERTKTCFQCMFCQAVSVMEFEATFIKFHQT